MLHMPAPQWRCRGCKITHRTVVILLEAGVFLRSSSILLLLSHAALLLPSEASEPQSGVGCPEAVAGSWHNYWNAWNDCMRLGCDFLTAQI